MAAPSQDRGSKNQLAKLLRYSEVGFIIPAAVIVGLLLGKVADHFLGTTWMQIVGVIFGAVVGFVQMIRLVIRWSKEEQ
jgi:F0F1-type ATP synthase assembly protein I